jgi:hypothetical protein
MTRDTILDIMSERQMINAQRKVETLQWVLYIIFACRVVVI